MMRRSLSAISILLAAGLLVSVVPPALADDDDDRREKIRERWEKWLDRRDRDFDWRYRDYHGFRDRDRFFFPDRHGRLHRSQEDLHEEFHRSGGFTRNDHRRFHKFLRKSHKEFHKDRDDDRRWYSRRYYDFDYFNDFDRDDYWRDRARGLAGRAFDIIF